MRNEERWVLSGNRFEDREAAPLTLYFYLLDLGKIYIRTDRTDEAERCLEEFTTRLKEDQRARTLFAKSFAGTELDKYLLELWSAEKRFSEADRLMEKMLSYALRERGPVHSYTMGIRYRQAGLMAKEGRIEEAAGEYRELLCLLEAEHPYWEEQIRRVREKLIQTDSSR